MAETLSRYLLAPEPSPSRETEVRYLDALYQKETFTKRKLGDKGLGVLYFESNEPTSDVPLILIPGFSAPSVVYVALAAKLADSGKNTAIYRPRRKQEPRAAFSPRHLRSVLDYQMQTVHEVMEAIRDDTESTDFDLSGHSMGNSIGTGVAYHHEIKRPNSGMHIRHLISDAGAGLDTPEHTTVRESVKRHAERMPNVFKYEIREQVPKMLEVEPQNMMREALAHVRDIGRLAREGWQVMTAPNVIRPLERLQQDSDIKIGALLPEHDQFFYAEEVKKRSGHLLDVATVIPGAYHVHANTHPDEHSAYILNLLEDLDSKKNAA